MIRSDPCTVALRYLEACSRGDFDTVVPLLAHDVVLQSPWGRFTGSQAVVKLMIKQAAHYRGAQVRKVFADGAESCVIYDLAFSTVPAVEWVKVEQGRITRLTLLVDRLQPAPQAQPAIPAPRPSHPA